MQIDKALFLYLLNHASPELIYQMDRSNCGCRYIYHWFYEMRRGSWNPHLNELDYELDGITSEEQLYAFLTSHKDDL